MPRETIETIDVSDRPPSVNVSWGPDTHVQIATTTYEDIPFWWQVLASGWDEEETEKRLSVLGELARSVVDQHAAVDNGETGRGESPASEVGRSLLNALDTTYGPMDGMYVSLNRRKINDLIRVLRRARDSAFGRDE